MTTISQDEFTEDDIRSLKRLEALMRSRGYRRVAQGISAGLQTHIAGEVTTLATCWKMTRRDATVLGFTDHDADIVFDSVTYKAATGFNMLQRGASGGGDIGDFGLI
jgi:hypothetical protein